VEVEGSEIEVLSHSEMVRGSFRVDIESRRAGGTAGMLYLISSALRIELVARESGERWDVE
jgi:hypothetical protein